MKNSVHFSASGSAPIKPKVYNNGFDEFIDDFAELHLYTSQMSYSTMFYKNGKRKKANVTGYGSILIYDIDKGYTGRELKKATEGFRRLIVTTMSHTVENPRMRLILPLDVSIPAETDEELYKGLMLAAAKGIGLDVNRIDTSCLSTDRQYAPNPKQQHFYFDGEVLEVRTLLSYASKNISTRTAPKPTRPVFTPSSAGMSLKQMRDYIKANHSFEIMAQLLESKGLTVKKNGAVVIPGQRTQALSINPKTGILADFAKDEFFDVVSVHVDHYQDMTIAEATKHYYHLLGGAA